MRQFESVMEELVQSMYRHRMCTSFSCLYHPTPDILPIFHDICCTSTEENIGHESHTPSLSMEQETTGDVRQTVSVPAQGFGLDESGCSLVDIVLDTVNVAHLSIRLLRKMLWSAPDRMDMEFELVDDGAIMLLLGKAYG